MMVQRYYNNLLWATLCFMVELNFLLYLQCFSKLGIVMKRVLSSKRCVCCSLRLRIVLVSLAFFLQFYAWGSVIHDDFSFYCTGVCSVEMEGVMLVPFDDSVPALRKGGSVSQVIKVPFQPANCVHVGSICALQGVGLRNGISLFFRKRASYLQNGLFGLFGYKDLLSDICVLRI